MIDTEYQNAIVEQAVEDSIGDLSDILGCVIKSLATYREKLGAAESAPTTVEWRLATCQAKDVRDTFTAWIAANLKARIRTLDLDDHIIDHEPLVEQAREAFLSATDIDLT